MIVNAKKRLAAKSIHTMSLPMGSDYEEYANILSQSKPGDVIDFGGTDAYVLAEDTFARMQNGSYQIIMIANRKGTVITVPAKVIKDTVKWVK
jgi:hypothetical protein